MKLHIYEHTATFFCPACKHSHSVNIEPGHGETWTWNGSLEVPTFYPSVLSTSGHYMQGWGDKPCYCTYNKEHPEEGSVFKCYRCHIWLKDGIIEFLSDCSHELAGKHVPLPDWRGYGE